MQTALITGSAKRIGREIAIHLSKQGYRVVIHYNSSSNEAENLAKEITNSQIVFGNLKHSDSARFILDQIDGEVSIIINNAAHFSNDTIENFTFDSFYRHLMVNLHAPISFTHEVLNRYKSCVIINVLDSWAHDYPTNFISYCTSKNALWDFTKQVANQIPKEFRINGIALGAVMHKEGYPKDIYKKLSEQYPTKIEDICNAIDNILSDEDMNGEIIDLVKQWK
jgi:NAD(P)-dependent dehydrogenase (short-subunit alcohol dehydrogenase family)